MDPEYELVLLKSAFSPEAYRIIENVLGTEAAQQTLYPCHDPIPWDPVPMDFYFPVGET